MEGGITPRLIDKEKLKNQLSKDDVIHIIHTLGGGDPREDMNGNLIFRTVCHNPHNSGSYKLYYYDNTKLFSCYTGCQASFDIFDLVTKNKQLEEDNDQWKFENSLYYVMDLTGYSGSFSAMNELEEQHRIDDWDFLNRYVQRKTPTACIQTYDKNVLSIYKDKYHEMWIKEDICIKSMKKFNIKFDPYNNKIIIPHYNVKNELIGIRGRSLNMEDLQNGRKYMPVRIENTIYSHPVSLNLYGLNHNLTTIQKLKKVFIVEGEKSVLKIESFYPDNNFSVAVCGDKISDYQKDLILKHVNEVIIGFDKDELYERRGKNSKLTNIRKIAQRFSPYVQTFIIADKKNLLQLKDAPVDQGKHVLQKLMKEKIEIKTIGW